ncbi:hypothetical protein ACIRF8_28550 [Streptomyces sp. NPDC102406]|uniref:hypothetical protein n=1 Tax=Streptomyces sp. NPDC102406 TaxID=3366171 RepID=UPI0038185EC2
MHTSRTWHLAPGTWHLAALARHRQRLVGQGDFALSWWSAPHSRRNATADIADRPRTEALTGLASGDIADLVAHTTSRPGT